uniref:Ferritin n=1 Tax=Ixodes ricinus TaxID=34613 RepID=A0A6B0V3N0_IXORI
MAATQPRQTYHVDCEALINKQINMEFYASYVYASMACYFDRDDVSLPGFHKFFKKCSHEETEHAEKLMAYQNKRGGRVVLQPIAKPAQDEWGSGLEAMQAALELEKTVNQSLFELHKLATEKDDGQVRTPLPTSPAPQGVSVSHVRGAATAPRVCAPLLLLRLSEFRTPSTETKWSMAYGSAAHAEFVKRAARAAYDQSDIQKFIGRGQYYFEDN